jgi:hypothetical protein
VKELTSWCAEMAKSQSGEPEVAVAKIAFSRIDPFLGEQTAHECAWVDRMSSNGRFLHLSSMP